MIDIIIPGFNCKKTLANCLDSIFCQSCKDKINVIFVDDCSDDNYVDVLEKYPKVKYFRCDTNRGPGYCRQLGLDNSKSEFVMFIDADDLLADSDSLELLYDAAKNDKDYVSSFVYCEASDMVISNAGDLHGKIYRRSFLKKNNISFSDSRMHEDNLFNSLVLLYGPRKAELGIVSYLYLKHSSSITSSVSLYSELSLREYIKNVSIIKERFSDLSEDAVKDYFDTKYNYLRAVYDEGDESSRRLISGLLDMHGLKPIK